MRVERMMRASGLGWRSSLGFWASCRRLSCTREAPVRRLSSPRWRGTGSVCGRTAILVGPGPELRRRTRRGETVCDRVRGSPDRPARARFKTFLPGADQPVNRPTQPRHLSGPASFYRSAMLYISLSTGQRAKVSTLAVPGQRHCCCVANAPPPSRARPGSSGREYLPVNSEELRVGCLKAISSTAYPNADQIRPDGEAAAPLRESATGPPGFAAYQTRSRALSLSVLRDGRDCDDWPRRAHDICYNTAEADAQTVTKSGKLQERRNKQNPTSRDGRPEEQETGQCQPARSTRKPTQALDSMSSMPRDSPTSLSWWR